VRYLDSEAGVTVQIVMTITTGLETTPASRRKDWITGARMWDTEAKGHSSTKRMSPRCVFGWSRPVNQAGHWCRL